MRNGASGPVFWDPTARRARIVRFAAGALAVAALLLLGSFLFSIAEGPSLGGQIWAGKPPAERAPAPHDRRFLAARRTLLRRIALDAKARPRTSPHAGQAAIAGAYFAPWQDGALADFSAHARALTHVYPAWLQLGG
ncbi:MAG: hypothetical protein AB7G04_10010, partial [Hyphomonadaceae bacterium]